MSPPRRVRTYKLPGNSAFISAAALIPPRICATTSNTQRSGLIILTSASAREIAGLNNPPEILKKTHTFTMSENPNASAINIRFEVLTVLVVDSCDVEGVGFALFRFAICVPANAKNKNIVVPINSPTIATNSIRQGCESNDTPFFMAIPRRPRRRLIRLEPLASVPLSEASATGIVNIFATLSGSQRYT